MFFNTWHQLVLYWSFLMISCMALDLILECSMINTYQLFNIFWWSCALIDIDLLVRAILDNSLLAISFTQDVIITALKIKTWFLLDILVTLRVDKQSIFNNFCLFWILLEWACLNLGIFSILICPVKLLTCQSGFPTYITQLIWLFRASVVNCLLIVWKRPRLHLFAPLFVVCKWFFVACIC